MAQLNPAGSFVDRSKSNVDHPLNAAQIIELGVAIAGKIQEIYQKSWDLKARITAAQTVEEVREVTWNSD
jgi:hypothetical protein